MKKLLLIAALIVIVVLGYTFMRSDSHAASPTCVTESDISSNVLQLNPSLTVVSPKSRTDYVMFGYKGSGIYLVATFDKKGCMSGTTIIDQVLFDAWAVKHPEGVPK